MALDLRLEYIGGGQFRAGGKLDFDLAGAELATGERVRAKITRMRSVRQNNMFHALIQSAFDNQRGGPKVETWEHLKSWLLIEAGHCTEHRVSLAGMDNRAVAPILGAMAAILRQKYDTVAVSYDRGRHEAVMRFAKSVSFAATDSDQMKDVVDRVIGIICTQIVPGVDQESLMNMAKEKAA